MPEKTQYVAPEIVTDNQQFVITRTYNNHQHNDPSKFVFMLYPRKLWPVRSQRDEYRGKEIDVREIEGHERLGPPDIIIATLLTLGAITERGIDQELLAEKWSSNASGVAETAASHVLKNSTQMMLVERERLCAILEVHGLSPGEEPIRFLEALLDGRGSLPLPTAHKAIVQQIINLTEPEGEFVELARCLEIVREVNRLAKEIQN